MPRGGPRPGSGRPKGQPNAAMEVCVAARAHTQTALDALVEVAQDKSHPQRVRAAEALLNRAYGQPKVESRGAEVVRQFADGEISAIAAALLLAVEGEQVPKALERYVSNEFARAGFVPFSNLANSLESPPAQLPLE